MARFTIYMGVLAIFLLFEDVGMTRLAGPVAGEVWWPGGNLRQRIAAIVPVLSETFWNQKRAEDQKEQDAKGEHSRQSKKMSRILECIHGMLCRNAAAPGLLPPFLAIEADPS